MSALKPPSQKIGDLQVLRGAAILLVLLEHAPLTRTIVGLLPHPIAFPGWLGVDLFFVVSGYVIARTLSRDRFEPIAFFVRRLFRLTPALLILVAMIGGLTLLLSGANVAGLDRKQVVPEPGEFWPTGISVLCGYFSLGPQAGGVLFGVAWSLSVEDLFYAAMTSVCFLSAAILGRKAPRVLPGLLFALAAAVYLLVLWMRLEFLYLGHIKVTSWRPFLYLFFLRFDFLAIGVMLGLTDGRYRQAIAKLFVGRGPFWTPILLGTPLALSAVCGEIVVLSRPVFGLVLPVAGWCFGLLVLSAAHENALPPARGIAYRFWTYLGDRSYTIYLFHWPAMLAASVLLSSAFGPWAVAAPVRAGILQVAIAATVLLPFVECIYRGVELPLTAVGRRVSRRLQIIPEEALPPTASPVAFSRRRAA